MSDYTYNTDQSSNQYCTDIDHSYGFYYRMTSSTLLQAPAAVLRPVMGAFSALPVYLQVLVLLIGVPALAIALNVASQLVSSIIHPPSPPPPSSVLGVLFTYLKWRL